MTFHYIYKPDLCLFVSTDAVVVSYVNCATSMGGRFSIFSVVGLMAHTLGREVAQLVVSSSKIAN